MTQSQRPADLSDCKFTLRWPVQWGDQDAFGHVNNTIYFRWFESARIAYLEQLGLSAVLQQMKIGPILAAIDCNFRRQLKFPDHVRIGARITRLGRSSLTMEHLLFSERLDQMAADGNSTIVVFDYERQKPVGIPAELRAIIQQYEGRTFE
jgi:acyl-CoA thioester hydrolase